MDRTSLRRTPAPCHLQPWRRAPIALSASPSLPPRPLPNRPPSLSATPVPATGFNAAVTAACAGAPPASTCTLTPTSVTPAANATATINGTVSTTARTLAPPPRFFRAPPRFPLWLWGFLSCVLAILAAWAATRRTRKLAFGFGLLSLLALTGCSGPLHGGTPDRKCTR